jgi:hypothetical protein
MCGGAALFFGRVYVGTPSLLSGIFLFSLGIYAVPFRSWQRELGLWMLSAFFLAMVLPIYAVFLYASMITGLGGAVVKNAWTMLDFVAGTLVLLLLVRFLLTLALLNGRLSFNTRRRASARPLVVR